MLHCTVVRGLFEMLKEMTQDREQWSRKTVESSVLLSSTVIDDGRLVSE